MVKMGLCISLAQERAIMLGTIIGKRDGDTDTCLSATKYLDLACVVGVNSFFALQTWQCMVKGYLGPQEVADKMWSPSQGRLVHWSLEI